MDDKRIQVDPDGTVTNIPNNMLKDEYGMAGLLSLIKKAKEDPEKPSLVLGEDLTELYLDSPYNLYSPLAGLWDEHPFHPPEIDMLRPPQYLINDLKRENPPKIYLCEYQDSVLFYLFYGTNYDFVIEAATELYNRDWRFHVDDQLWLTRIPGMLPYEKTFLYEKGTYYFFDSEKWKLVPGEFYIDYNTVHEWSKYEPFCSEFSYVSK
ncbi:CCR4-NOT transcription complex subunit 2 isoform X2 [Aethina tumida]|uniref:CCR4-NOT transcription complex subunit 2 isoform X2 n=1 Tax=Aethina tumida TaxID=116153 RepID=UPI00096B31EC|nr:CCR4-NOT transcription complex subunit 2 isoform X2 [Aethina tumida]